MAGVGGKGAGLSPAGHAAVDEARIVVQQHVGAEAQPLHHAGAVAFDQAVSARDDPADRGDALRRLEVDRH